MLLPENIHPENSIYYNGSFVLKSLEENPSQTLLDLYQDVNGRHKMSFPVFVLCLDWLYLLNVTVLNQQGRIELCI